MTHLDARMTLRSLLYDLLAAIAGGSFVAAVAIWLPHIAQHH